LGAARRPSYTFAPQGTLRVSVTQYFEDYITVAVFAGFGILLVMVSVGASALLRPKKPTPVKSATYECGMDPVGGGWNQTHIRFYIFGLLFLIFDVEAVFIFPWAVKLEELGAFALVEMVIFIVILLAGLVYAVRKGVLRWES
jgi:NADH-quinone oxidoreductase subunit A